MSVKKATQQELKRPDKFVAFFLRQSEKLRSNTGPVVAVVVVFLVLFIGSLAWMKHRADIADAAQYTYAVLFDQAHEALTMDLGPERQAALRDVSAELQAFYEEHENTDAGALSLLSIGQVQFELGNHRPAANAFEQAAEQIRGNPRFQAMAYVGAGKAYEAQRDLDRAMDFYQRASLVEGNPYDRVLENDMARLSAYQQRGGTPTGEAGVQQPLTLP